jgi:hypothetical protein
MNMLRPESETTAREFYAAKRLGFKSAGTATNRSIGQGGGKHASPRLNLTGRFWTSSADWTAPVTRSPPLRAFTAASAERKFL